MELTKPTRGQANWHTPLNAALDTLAEAITDHEEGDDPHGDRAWATSQFIPGGAETAAFLAQEGFYVAHRGSGGEFPEHTLAAYESAVAAGARAIEVSVGITADGVLVCLHDPTLDRTTNSTGQLVDYSWAEVRNTVRAAPQALLGSGWENQPLVPLREVLDRFLGRVTIFLEPKANEAYTPLRMLLRNNYPGAQESVVWKDYYLSTALSGARSEGYTVWAYVDAGTTDEQMAAVDANVDMWGVPYGMTDLRIADVVARGKPVICWEVHRHSDVARLSDLGVQGFMCSQMLYLTRQPFFASDRFSSEISVPGTLPTVNYSDTRALKYDGAGGAYIENSLPLGSVLMGGHRAPDAESHTIRFSMKWEVVPGSTLHSGIAFCRSWDDPYVFSTANNTYSGERSPGGYHVVMRGNGDMQLFSHTEGVTSGTLLGTIATPTPVNDTYMDFEVVVTETHVTLRRLDGAEAPYEVSVANTDYRGRYWHLSVGSVNSATNLPHWSGVTVS